MPTSVSEIMARPGGSVWLFGVIGVLAVVIGLSIPENGRSAWHTVHLWGVLAIVAAAATLAPVLGKGIGLNPERAWRVSWSGAAALLLFWLMFVFPDAGSNGSLIVTIGVAAGVAATWYVWKGRAGDRQQGPHAW